MGGQEDLRIIKLMLYVFEGLSGLGANLDKTCLYSCSSGLFPEDEAVATLTCVVGLLPLTYLRILISGRRPRREGLTEKVRRRLAA